MAVFGYLGQVNAAFVLDVDVGLARGSGDCLLGL